MHAQKKILIRVIQIAFLTFAVLPLASCNRNLFDKIKGKGSSSEDQKNAGTSDPTIQDNDRPSEELPSVPGYYFICLDKAPEEANKVQIACKSYSSERKEVVAVGLWTGVIEKPQPNEELKTLDSKTGTFQLTYPDPTQLARVLDRVQISFVGTVNEQKVEASNYVGRAPEGFACATGYVLVPGDVDYAHADFCVMKYEAKKDWAGSNRALSTPEEAPWVSLSQVDARLRCEAEGMGYHLIKNEEWMSIGVNVASKAANWTGNAIGTGRLFAGHSDQNPSYSCPASSDDHLGYVETDCTARASDAKIEQQRAHTLSNGAIIWDIAGNEEESVDYINRDDKPKAVLSDGGQYPTATGSKTTPLVQLVPNKALKSYWVDTWDDKQSIGTLYTDVNGVGGALTRGGSSQGRGGLFTASFNSEPDKPASGGFRCARLLIP